MVRELDALHDELERLGNELCSHYLSGLAAPTELRSRCDHLVAHIEDLERDLVDARAAILGTGEEIEQLLARQNTDLQRTTQQQAVALLN